MSLFRFDSISVSFGKRQVLKDFSLSISEGEKVVLRGASGSGKSTILHLLPGFCQPDSGCVLYRGSELTPGLVKQLRKEVAYVGQAVEMLPGQVAESLSEIFSIKACPNDPGDERVAAVLEQVGLSREVLKQNIQELSGGERHRIGLATALLLGRSIFLLDEPTAALDSHLKERIADLFLGNPEWTVVVAAHDPVWYSDRDVSVVDLSV